MDIATAKASIGKAHYLTNVTSGGGNSLIADEPLQFGGGNLGFSPDELLSSALATCTAITVRMYADRKDWPLEALDVDVAFSRTEAHKDGQMQVVLTLHGAELTAEHRHRLLQIAGKCPVHKTLAHGIPVHLREGSSEQPHPTTV